jgi:hypothetical protein
MSLRNWPADWTIGPALSPEQIEADNLHEDDGRVPHLPFGFGHDKWAAFKAQAQPGDTFHAFSSSAESWRNLAGRAGFVLVRGEEALATFGTIMN